MILVIIWNDNGYLKKLKDIELNTHNIPGNDQIYSFYLECLNFKLIYMCIIVVFINRGIRHLAMQGKGLHRITNTISSLSSATEYTLYQHHSAVQAPRSPLPTSCRHYRHVINAVFS